MVITSPARRLALCICSSVMMLHASAADSTDYTVDTYTYKTIASQELKLDVFHPGKNLSPHALLPVIILFHGGSWISGERSNLAKQCRYFAAHGIIAVTADYRFMNDSNGGKKICIMDAKSAIRWVKGHAAILSIDTGKIMLGGGSAGGHLATMAALSTTINDPSDDTAISTAASALVLFNPAYQVDDDPAVQPFKLPLTDPPPMILFFGTRDKWKPAAETFLEAVKKKKTPNELWTAEGQTHAFFNKSPWDSATCIQAHIFLNKLGLMGNDFSRPSTALLLKEE